MDRWLYVHVSAEISINDRKNIVLVKVLYLILRLLITAFAKAKSNLIDWKTKFYP